MDEFQIPTGKKKTNPGYKRVHTVWIHLYEVLKHVHGCCSKGAGWWKCFDNKGVIYTDVHICKMYPTVSLILVKII